MRATLTIILILLVILGGDTLIQNYMESTASEMVKELENLKTSTIESKETKDRENTKEKIREVEDKWEKIGKIWSMIIPHEELDHLEEAMVKSKSSIYDGELEEALEEIETATFFIKHIREREKILLKNIF